MYKKLQKLKLLESKYKNLIAQIKNSFCDKFHTHGVIYMATSQTSKKSYIGQAANCVSANIKWGMNGRWKSHFREAYNHKQNRCRVLNAAIRKYSSDGFRLKQLGEYPMENLDMMEEYFILHYHTMVPNGYNLRSGGSKCYDSKSTKSQKKKGQKKRIYKDDMKKNISIRQIGNRRSAKKRKYKEDEWLPKYISAIRDGYNVVGYGIYKYPIGVNEVKYVKSRTFACKKNSVEKNYELAVEHLENLKIKYADIKEQIELKRQEQEKLRNRDWFQIKKQKTKDNLPEYIYPIFIKKRIRGYYVEGVFTHDNSTYPRKYFNDRSSNYKNLNAAKRYIKSLDVKNKDMIFMEQLNKQKIHKNSYQHQKQNNLPKYITYVKVNNKIIGFAVNNYPIRNANGIAIKKIKKKFCTTKETMESKYNKTIVYLNELKSNNHSIK